MGVHIDGWLDDIDWDQAVADLAADDFDNGRSRRGPAAVVRAVPARGVRPGRKRAARPPDRHGAAAVRRSVQRLSPRRVDVVGLPAPRASGPRWCAGSWTRSRASTSGSRPTTPRPSTRRSGSGPNPSSCRRWSACGSTRTRPARDDAAARVGHARSAWGRCGPRPRWRASRRPVRRSLIGSNRAAASIGGQGQRGVARRAQGVDAGDAQHEAHPAGDVVLARCRPRTTSWRCGAVPPTGRAATALMAITPTSRARPRPATPRRRGGRRGRPTGAGSRGTSPCRGRSAAGPRVGPRAW